MFLTGRGFLNQTTFMIKRYFMLTKHVMREMPDPLQLATGLEKKELIAFKEGNCDPFHNNMIKRGKGTIDNPTLIPSAFNERIIGCICQENRFVNFMWLEKDCPKRCECGHWYKLKTVENFKD